MNHLNKELKDNFLKNQNFINNNNFNNNKNYNLNSNNQIIAKTNASNLNNEPEVSNTCWDEGMYNQLKTQIAAFRYMVRNQLIPEEILNTIIEYQGSNWLENKNKQLRKNTEILKDKFKDYDLTMKELAPYFKKRIKEQDLMISSMKLNNSNINNNNSVSNMDVVNNINNLMAADRSFINDIDFSYENELEFRKIKIQKLIELYDNSRFKLNNNKNSSYNDSFNINNEDSNSKEDFILYLNNEQQLYFGFKSSINYSERIMLENQLKLLKLYNLQTRVRKEVLTNHITDMEKQSSIYYTDVLFEKTLLDRKNYKRIIPDKSKKDQKINDRFEQQLRHGYDIRKKNKHRDFINDVMLLQKEFSEFYKEKKNKFRKRALMVKTFIDVKEKRDIQAKEKSDRDRLKYLKDNDLDRYVKLLKEAKNTRLLDFLGQTSAFLKEIEDKVAIQKEANKEIKDVIKKERNEENEEVDKKAEIEVEKEVSF